MFHSRISATGYYLPKKILTNKDLEKIVDTSDEWIRKRTGIHSRHIASETELPSDMGKMATLKALKQTTLSIKDIQLIIVATLCPDQLMPNTACVLQTKIGATCPALDISSACSGFVYALTIANQFIQNGTYQNILVVGTETLHSVTNYQDRGTCILFGDGAGACIVSQNTEKQNGCIYHQELMADGSLGHLLTIPAPGAKKPADPNIAKSEYCIAMKGPQVFKKAVEMMCKVYTKTLKHTNHTSDQIDWIVPHQANKRILSQFCKTIGYPEKQVICDIQTTGNTSAASIPITLARAIEQNKIQRGQNILIISVGGGMTAGSILLKY